MIEQFINFVIRPPRAEYNPEQYLWEPEFSLLGRKYKRVDLELKNERGHTLHCSHYVPFEFPDGATLPCVIYCHGNSGCRADANEAVVVLLPSNITVFTLDFSGSGLSDGDYVSLGWHEKNDLKVAISYLRTNKHVSAIGLWGRSMGAVTSLLYGAEDPSIAGMVLDSAFSNLFDLMMELAAIYRIRLPKFAIKIGLRYMRRVIQKRAKFDIIDLNVLPFAAKIFIPALIGHASEDMFVPPHHSDLVYNAYAGEKNMMKFKGDHNSRRPQFYYDSVSIFFCNVLQPPQIPSTCSSKLEKRYDLGGLQIEAGDKRLVYEIITSLRAAGGDAACCSSAPTGIPIGTGLIAKSVVEMLSESAAHMSADDLDFLLHEDNRLTDIGGNGSIESTMQDDTSGQNEQCCSCSSSNRESWGRCSSLGGESDRSSPEVCADSPSNRHQMKIRVLATPLQRLQKSWTRPKEKKKGTTEMEKPKPRKRESINQRLRRLVFHWRAHHK